VRTAAVQFRLEGDVIRKLGFARQREGEEIAALAIEVGDHAARPQHEFLRLPRQGVLEREVGKGGAAGRGLLQRGLGLVQAAVAVFGWPKIRRHQRFHAVAAADEGSDEGEGGGGDQAKAHRGHGVDQNSAVPAARG
jgi:hypothetical protein